MSEIQVGRVDHIGEDHHTVRHEFDPTTGEAQFFTEVAMSEDDYLKSMGIPKKVTRAREKQSEQIRSRRLENRVTELTSLINSEREEHQQEVEGLNKKIDDLTELVGKLVTDLTARASEPSTAEATTETLETTVEEPAPTPPEPEAVTVATETPPEAEATRETEVVEPLPNRRLVTEETVWYRRPRAVIGAGAAALILATGTAYAVWQGMETDDTEDTVHRIEAKLSNQSSNKIQSGGGAYQVAIPAAGRHNAYYNPSPKGRKTAVGLPGNLKIRYNLNSESIVDKDNNIVVKRVMWDEQGNLSQTTRKQLAVNYHLTQGKIGDRFKTKVWNK